MVRSVLRVVVSRVCVCLCVSNVGWLWRIDWANLRVVFYSFISFELGFGWDFKLILEGRAGSSCGGKMNQFV